MNVYSVFKVLKLVGFHYAIANFLDQMWQKSFEIFIFLKDYYLEKKKARSFSGLTVEIELMYCYSAVFTRLVTLILYQKQIFDGLY